MIRFRSPLLAATAAALLAACGKQEESTAVPIETVAASMQRIVVDVEATGVITPIAAVDVRSKASGQITTLAVATGDRVTKGQLLVRIDPRDPQSRFDQARAALAAADAQVEVTRTQYDRNRQLLAQGVLTAPELEATRTASAAAQSAQVAARTQLQLARIALEDVTIVAPSAGTVIARNVAEGTVIASSANSPSGGTILLTLADLGTVYDSTLVNESDIGKVKPGMAATITVDAYPGRTFRGVVEKVEPRATIVQSVTFFPVLIRIDNEDGALMPGMNTDVAILVEEKDGVLAVPVDAVRSPRDAATAASALGIDPETVRAQLAAARGSRAQGADAAGRQVAAGESGGRPASATGGAARAGATGSGTGSRNGTGTGRSTRAVVFVATGTGFEPRMVMLGTSNYDVAEVTSGLREGEKVALVSAAALQQARTERNAAIRSRTALPGMGGSGSSRSGGSGGGGGGGGSRGGG